MKKLTIERKIHMAVSTVSNADIEKKEIEGFEDYFICSDGTIIKKNGRIISSFSTSDGVPFVTLHKRGVRSSYRRSVARLVADAFLPGEPKMLKNMIHYKDGNKSNVDISNLEWGTRDILMENIGSSKVCRTLDIVNLKTGEKNQIRSVYDFAYVLTNEFPDRTVGQHYRSMMNLFQKDLKFIVYRGYKLTYADFPRESLTDVERNFNLNDYKLLSEVYKGVNGISIRKFKEIIQHYNVRCFVQCATIWVNMADLYNLIDKVRVIDGSVYYRENYNVDVPAKAIMMIHERKGIDIIVQNHFTNKSYKFSSFTAASRYIGEVLGHKVSNVLSTLSKILNRGSTDYLFFTVTLTDESYQKWIEHKQKRGTNPAKPKKPHTLNAAYSKCEIKTKEDLNISRGIDHFENAV